MPVAPKTRECAQCGPRLVSQFRRRPGGRLNSICRRCTKLNTRRARWESRQRNG